MDTIMNLLPVQYYNYQILFLSNESTQEFDKGGIFMIA